MFIQSNVSFLGEFDFSELFSLGHLVLVFDSHDTTSPLFVELLVLVELSSELSGESFQVLDVFLSDISESDAGGGLEVHKLAEVGLAADEAEGDTLLSAESGQVNNELNRVDVVGDDNELGLVLLDEVGHVVETELEVDGLGGLGRSTGLGRFLETLLLLLPGLGHVLGKQFKELGRYWITIIN